MMSTYEFLIGLQQAIREGGRQWYEHMKVLPRVQHLPGTAALALASIAVLMSTASEEGRESSLVTLDELLDELTLDEVLPGADEVKGGCGCWRCDLLWTVH